MSQGMPKESFGEQFKFVVEGEADNNWRPKRTLETLLKMAEKKSKDLQANLAVILLLFTVQNHLVDSRWERPIERVQIELADTFRLLTEVLEAYPDFISTLDLQQLEDLILKREGFHRFTAERVAQIGMPRILELCSDPLPPVQLVCLTAVQIAIAQIPDLLQETHVDQFLAFLADPDETVAWAAKTICKGIIEKKEQLIPKFLQLGLESCSSGPKRVREMFIFLFKKIIEVRSKYITIELTKKLFELGLDIDNDVSWIAFAAYQTAIKKRPQFLIPEHIRTILNLCVSVEWIKRWAALRIMRDLVQIDSNYLPPNVFYEIIAGIAKKNDYERLAVLKIIDALKETPYINADVTNILLDLFETEVDFVRKPAVKLYSYFIEHAGDLRSSQIFESSDISKLIKLCFHRNGIIQSNALEAYKLHLKYSPFIIQDNMRELYKWFSNEAEEVRLGAVHLYHTTIKQSPQLLDEMGVVKLIEVFRKLRHKDNYIFSSLFATIEKHNPALTQRFQEVFKGGSV
jgi:hypothetical protein